MFTFVAQNVCAVYQQMSLSVQLNATFVSVEIESLWCLSAALRSKMKAMALKECKTSLAAFADCARGRTVSVVWACRKEAEEMNECLHQ